MPTEIVWLLMLSLLLQGAHGKGAAPPVSNCDQAFSSDLSKNGTFTSPNFPHPYPPKTHCRYEFAGTGRERVQVIFTDFNLYHPEEKPSSCESSDAIMVFVYTNGQPAKIDNFCGSNIPKPVMSNGPKMLIEFRAPQSARYVKGFKAMYTFIDNFGITGGNQLSEFPCSFAFNSTETSNGTFSSPNYPGYYPRDTECHYFFNGRDNKEKVRLQFTYFDVEGVQPCEEFSDSDYVEFSNFMTQDRKYPRYCGELKEFQIESDRRFFHVTFRSNDRFDATGFQANYQFGEFADPITIKRVKSEATTLMISGNYIVLTVTVIMCAVIRVTWW